MLNRGNMLKTIRISLMALMILSMALGAQSSSDILGDVDDSDSEMRPMLQMFSTDHNGIRRCSPR